MWEALMGATSITGAGIGESKGKYKKDNNGGCCGKSTPTTTTTSTTSRGCYVKLKGCQSKTIKGCSSIKIKGC